MAAAMADDNPKNPASELSRSVNTSQASLTQSQSSSSSSAHQYGPSYAGHTTESESATIAVPPPSEKNDAVVIDKTANPLEDEWETHPDNARNWPKKKKWVTFWIVSLYTLIPALPSAMIAPALPEIIEIYKIHDQISVVFALNAALLSEAVGMLLFAPLSEMYGRKWILHLANLSSLIFNLGCAFAPTIQVFIVLRVLCGFVTIASFACGGGVVADLFSISDRATPIGFYAFGPLLAPTIGPTVGGFLAQTVGVKYIFITIAATAGIIGLIGIPLLHETYPPVLRAKQTKRQRDAERCGSFKSQLPLEDATKLRDLWLNVTRPIIMLTRSFICFVLSLYMGLMHGISRIILGTFSDFFQSTYGFSSGTVGLVYIGLGGSLMAVTFLGARWTDYVYRKLVRRNSGISKPEFRIPSLFAGAVMVPIGLLWYGWSAQLKLHWIMPILGYIIFESALTFTSIPIFLYLVDVFTYAASALAAASVFGSFLGFGFPLFGPAMYQHLGTGGGASLLAGLTIILGFTFPVWIYYCGEVMRKRSSFTR